MLEHEIRPLDLQKQQEVLFRIDLERMMKRRNEFLPVSCPACNHFNPGTIFTKNGIGFSKCSKCRTLYATPRPTAEIMKEYYSNSEHYKFWATKIYPLTEKTRREKIFIPRVDNIIELCHLHHIQKGTLIEIGPGFGTFCEEMASRNFFENIIPIEPTPELATSLRNKGFTVIEKFIEEVNETEVAEVIVAFEVIEHMLDPKKFLNVIHNLLKPSGLFIFTTPNCDGFDTLVLQEKAPAVDVDHLTLFNTVSISDLMKKSGFKIISLNTPGILDTDIVRNRLTADKDLASSNPLLKYLLVDNWEKYGEKLQHFITSNNLSGNMMVTASKI